MSDGNRRIYIDFDDCLSQTAATLITVVADKFGKSIPYESVVSFDLEKSFNLTKDEWHQLMEMAHHEDILSDMPVIEGARHSITHFYNQGYEIHIVTGRPPTTEDASREWLKKHTIPYHHISFVDKYLRFNVNGGKRDFMTLDELKNESYFFAIEDSKHMAAFISEQMNVPVFLLDRPWNQDPTKELNPDRVVRCEGWTDLKEKSLTSQ